MIKISFFKKHKLLEKMVKFLTISNPGNETPKDADNERSITMVSEQFVLRKMFSKKVT